LDLSDPATITVSRLSLTLWLWHKYFLHFHLSIIQVFIFKQGMQQLESFARGYCNCIIT